MMCQAENFLYNTEKVNSICVSDFMGTCITCIYLIIFALFSWIVPSPSLVKMLSVGFWTVLTKTTHNPNVIQSNTEHRLHKPVYPYTWRSGLTHTLKDVIFIQHWNFKSSYMQELLRVFETPPLNPMSRYPFHQSFMNSESKSCHSFSQATTAKMSCYLKVSVFSMKWHNILVSSRTGGNAQCI